MFGTLSILNQLASFHWTLQVLIGLCALCVLFNVVGVCMGLKPKVSGILICVGWFIQQTYWWVFQVDSVLLFYTCDAVIIVWFIQHRFRCGVFGHTEKLIAATIPLTTALGTFAWLNSGHTIESWYANWSLVAGQMLLGLPFYGVKKLIPEGKRDTPGTFDPWDQFDLLVIHGEDR